MDSKQELTAPVPRAGTQRIKPHMVTSDATHTSDGVINIASNESAIGPSPKAIEAARLSIGGIERYAETAQHELTQAIATHYQLNQNGIVCGHGSDDLLARIARAYLSPGDELIYSRNGYQKIPNYAYANDAEAVAANDRNFTVDVDSVLECVTDRTRVVMIANPDNPTGTYISGAEVRRLHAGLPPHVLLVMDSAYLEYVNASDYENPRSLVEDNHNVVMTRTFSKIFGLAGTRLGWMYAPEDIADVVRRIGTTFPISSPALAAGLCALEDVEHTQSVYQQNLRTRDQFVQSLLEFGAIVYPSQTNFVLVEFTQCDFSALAVYEHLEVHGVLTRRLASVAFANCVRFTIGLESEMQRVSELLENLKNGTQKLHAG